MVLVTLKKETIVHDINILSPHNRTIKVERMSPIPTYKKLIRTTEIAAIIIEYKIKSFLK